MPTRLVRHSRCWCCTGCCASGTACSPPFTCTHPSLVFPRNCFHAWGPVTLTATLDIASSWASRSYGKTVREKQSEDVVKVITWLFFLEGNHVFGFHLGSSTMLGCNRSGLLVLWGLWLILRKCLLISSWFKGTVWWIGISEQDQIVELSSPHVAC